MRRRFIYDKDSGELVEVSSNYAPSTDAQHRAPHANYDGLVATDGTPIDTKTKHREYMRRNGLTTIDDFTQQWRRDAQAREAYRTTGRGGAITKYDIARAIHKLETGRDPER